MHLAERKNNSEPNGCKRLATPSSSTQLLGRVFAAVENFSRPREQQDDMAAALFHLCS